MVGGIDTHCDLHQAAGIDSIGRHLATQQFETTPDGYRGLLHWLRSHGEVLAVGIEGTGAYAAEVARFRTANEVTVEGVNRPDRKTPGGTTASPTASTLTRPRPRSFRGGPRAHRRPGTGFWRRSGPCGWSARARSRPARRPSTRSEP